MKANYLPVPSTVPNTHHPVRFLNSQFSILNSLRPSPPAPRPPAPARRAFTLIELMVVIGIISLLIAIVLPSINAARIQARAAATRQTINVLETGVEQFRADQTVGGDYPPSGYAVCLSPHAPANSGTTQFVGANQLVWALAGADLLGTPGFRDVNGNGAWGDDIHNSFVDTGSPNNGLYAIDPYGRPAFPRSGPFVELSRMKLSERVTGTNPMEFRVPSARSSGARTTLFSMCFLDAFDQPILYYRAQPGNIYFVGSEMTTGIDWTGIYNLSDNGLITGAQTTMGMDFGAGPSHPMAQLGWNITNPTTPPPRGTFAYQLWDQQVYAVMRPHRPDSFVLISAGADGLYGTADDLANFPTPK